MNTLLAKLREQRASLKATIDATLETVEKEERDALTDSEEKNVREAADEIKALDARIEELSEIELRNAKAAELAAKVDGLAGRSPEGVVVVKRDEATYRPDIADTSFFKDVVNYRQDPNAAERLHRAAAETRDVSSTDLGTGFVPPAYLASEYVTVAKAGRPIANVMPNRGAPVAETMYVPRVTTAASVDFQSSQNAALGESVIAGDTITAVTRTIGGFADVSVQALRFGSISDRDIFEQLVQDHASKIETMVINSSTTSNKGFLQASGITTVTYTDAAPTASAIYRKLGEAIAEIHTDTFSAPEVIFCTPTVWQWIVSSSDSTGRPLGTDIAPANSVARFGSLGAEGVVGSMHGLPVVISTLVPKGSGGASTHNNIVVARVADSRLWESPVQVDTFSDVGSASLTVRFRLFNFVAQAHERRAANFATIIGTGTILTF